MPVHWHSALLARQLRTTSPQYEAKELWIAHDHTRPQHSACELPHMHLFLPETECKKILKISDFINYKSTPFFLKKPHTLNTSTRPGWEQTGTGVEHCTLFLLVFPQACGEFHT